LSTPASTVRLKSRSFRPPLVLPGPFTKYWRIYIHDVEEKGTHSWPSSWTWNPEIWHYI